MIKPVLTSFCLLAASTVGFASTPLQLVFETKGGDRHFFEANGLSMVVNSNVLNVVSTEKTEDFELANLAKMYFSTETNRILLPTFDFTEGEVEVIAANGSSLGVFKSASEATSRVIAAGVYLLKSADGSVKYIVK